MKKEISMQSLETFYQSELMPDLIQLEDLRKTAKKKMVPVVVLAALFNLACLILLVKTGLPLNMMLIALFISAVPVFVWYAKYFKGYKDRFKAAIIPKIVAFIHPELKYEKDGKVPRNEFINSRLFAEHPDRYYGDDLVSGTLGRTAIQFSEIQVKRVEKVRDHSAEADSSRKTRTNVYPIFRGLFFVADFNKSFSGTTIVLPDKAEKLLGGMGQALQKLNVRNGELIKLEDPEFERLFVVYGQDQVEARYILSTSLMERITAFQKNARKEIRLSFSGSKLYVAIAFDHELFEPALMDSLLDFSGIKEYYDDMKLMTDIVQELDLNTRIWSKQ
jgi:hypothetical protein